jgi:hypothetical protein
MTYQGHKVVLDRVGLWYLVSAPEI